MTGIGEASLVLGLIASTIQIFEAAQNIYEAASDAKGLPKKFRLAADQIPLVYNVLKLADKSIRAKNVSEEALQSAKPVLERCKESAAAVKDIFDKALPTKDDSRAERYKKAMRLTMKSNDVKNYMEAIFKSIELLAQNQVFQDAEALKDIEEAIEQLNNVSDEEEQPQIVHSGAGAINANTGGGTQKNYNNSGPGNQYNAEKQFFGRDQVKNQFNIVNHHHSQDILSITRTLPYAKGAAFNSYGEDNTTCHPDTRVDLLRQIQDWARQPHSKNIFWLNGMAGTGKSTISRTLAEWLTNQGHLGVVDLGASFFFKRGEGDRGSASRFFSTIIRELVLKIPDLDSQVAKVIKSDPNIPEKALGEQFQKLIYQPLQKVKITSTFIIVVDALDECEKESDIKIILSLWSQLPQITNLCLKLFLTSRPDLPIRLEFKKMSIDVHQDLILHNEVPRTTIQHDISIFLEDEFSKIRKNYNLDPPSGTSLGPDWPGNKVLQDLANMAIPLFIVAATVCRYVGDVNWDPKEQLKTILEFQGTGQLEQMEKTYLPALRKLSATLSNSSDEKRLYQQFRMIVGSIIALAEPLSVISLAALLNITRQTIALCLRPLHSVLQVPADDKIPVRTLHLSFSEFLLSEKCKEEPFGVDRQATHRVLFIKCLELLKGPDGLRENLGNLKYPGQPRKEIDPNLINERLPPAFQYACRYWVHHLQHSNIQLHDDDEVHTFLQEYFLNWLEALSLINRIAEVIGHLNILRSLLSMNKSVHLSSFLEDARRVVLANRYIVDLAPLQIYSSAMIFAPQNSIVRKICGETWGKIPTWIRKYPITPAMWGPELQKLEGHSSFVSAVAFSQDGSLLASASWDHTVRLWNPTTGQEVQKLEGHTRFVDSIAFSHDGSLLASASRDGTIRLWNPATGREVQKLKGYNGDVSAVTISHDGLLLASALTDGTVRLWNPATGREVQKIEGHIGDVNAVAFSHDSSLLASASKDRTARLWNPATGQEVQKLEGHTRDVTAVTFSHDSSLVASASYDETIRLWNPATGQEEQKLDRHTALVMAVAFSHNSLLLASASYDQTVRLWNPITGQEVQKLEGHTDFVRSVAFSPKGALLASASNDRTVRLWDLSVDQEVQKLDGHTELVKAIAFSHDGLLLASASQDKTVRLWKPTTGQEMQKLDGHTGYINAVLFSHDDSLLASASDDRTVRLWNPMTGQEMQKLDGHTHNVNSVAFSHDGSLLASASYDRTIRLWNVTTGQEMQKLNGHTHGVNTVAFSYDDSLLASASWDGTVRLWNLTTRQMKKLQNDNGSEIRMMSFTVDNKALLTDQGIIYVDDESIHELALQSDTNQTVKNRGNWIQRDGHNILWLPHEFRGECSALCGSTLAIGRVSGQVSFIQFDRC